jgi:hypothetical protein
LGFLACSRNTRGNFLYFFFFYFCFLALK